MAFFSDVLVPIMIILVAVLILYSKVRMFRELIQKIFGWTKNKLEENKEKVKERSNYTLGFKYD